MLVLIPAMSDRDRESRYSERRYVPDWNACSYKQMSSSTTRVRARTHRSEGRDECVERRPRRWTGETLDAIGMSSEDHSNPEFRFTMVLAVQKREVPTLRTRRSLGA